MSLTGLVDIVTGLFLTEVDNAQFQRAVADFPGVVTAVRHVTLVLVIDPEHLILPVVRIESVEVIEKIGFPAGLGPVIGIAGADLGTGR